MGLYTNRADGDIDQTAFQKYIHAFKAPKKHTTKFTSAKFHKTCHRDRIARVSVSPCPSHKKFKRKNFNILLMPMRMLTLRGAKNVFHVSNIIFIIQRTE